MSARSTISVLAAGMSRPRLDDGGGEEHVEAAVVEGVHLVVELGGRQLAVGDGEADLGDLVAQEGGDGVEVGDARDDVEGLAAAVVLAQERLADGEGVELADVGADGEAVDRGGGDQRELADAGEGELQGARDGGGGQGEDVDVGAQRLQALLVGDAEVLLLVDDEEAEVLEGHALGEEGVGADDELDACRRRGRRGSPRRPWRRRSGRAGGRGGGGRGSVRRSS